MRRLPSLDAIEAVPCAPLVHRDDDDMLDYGCCSPWWDMAYADQPGRRDESTAEIMLRLAWDAR